MGLEQAPTERGAAVGEGRQAVQHARRRLAVEASSAVATWYVLGGESAHPAPRPFALLRRRQRRVSSRGGSGSGSARGRQVEVSAQQADEHAEQGDEQRPDGHDDRRAGAVAPEGFHDGHEEDWHAGRLAASAANGRCNLSIRTRRSAARQGQGPIIVQPLGTFPSREERSIVSRGSRTSKADHDEDR